MPIRLGASTKVPDLETNSLPDPLARCQRLHRSPVRLGGGSIGREVVDEGRVDHSVGCAGAGGKPIGVPTARPYAPRLPTASVSPPRHRCARDQAPGVRCE